MGSSDDAAEDPGAAINDLHFRSWERHLRSKRRSGLTIGSYRLAFDHLAGRYPGRDLTELTQADIENHLIAALQELKATTVAIRFRSLRAFYNWAVREEIIERSPMARLTEPKVTDVPPAVLPDDLLKRLLKACDGKAFDDRRDTAIIRLFCEPGSPRLAEIAGIRLRDDLDMGSDKVRVRGKGDKVRVIPFGTKTGVALDRYLRVRTKHRLAASPLLWLGTRGGAMTGSGIAQMLSRRAVAAGIGHIHPHQLRHTAAHNFMDNGGSEGDAQELFGWSSAEMPRLYGRSARTERAHRAARRMSLGDRL